MILDPSQGSSRQISVAPGIFSNIQSLCCMFFVRDAIFTKLQEHPMSPCMSIFGIIKHWGRPTKEQGQPLSRESSDVISSCFASSKLDILKKHAGTAGRYGETYGGAQSHRCQEDSVLWTDTKSNHIKCIIIVYILNHHDNSWWDVQLEANHANMSALQPLSWLLTQVWPVMEVLLRKGRNWWMSVESQSFWTFLVVARCMMWNSNLANSLEVDLFVWSQKS